jgi:hypothetical protein
MTRTRFFSALLATWLCAATSILCAQSAPPARAGEDPTAAPTARQEPVKVAGAETAEQDDRAPVPALINGEVRSLAFSSELDRTNFLSGGVTVGATYDDNVLSDTTKPVGGYTASILPYIAIDQSRNRIHWDLNYAAGFVANQRLSDENQQSHNFGGDLEYRLSPHVDLRVSDHFLYTTSFFDLLQQNVGSPGSGALQQPNQSVITPLAKRISNLASAEVNYQYSANDMVGGSGTFYTSRFRDVPAGSVTLLDTDTQQADGFYTHRMTRSDWLGAAYEYQQLSFTPGSDQATTHSFLLFNTIYLRPRMSFSIFGGPEHFDYDSQQITQVVAVPVVLVVSTPVSRQKWTYSAGANFNWQGERTSAQLGVSRRVTDGGGILGPVELVSAEAALRQKITRSTTVALGGVAGDNRLLANFNGVADKLRSTSGSVALEQMLGRSFMVSLGYGRDYQRQSGGTPPPTDVNHNRGWVSLTYSFSKAIGR